MGVFGGESVGVGIHIQRACQQTTGPVEFVDQIRVPAGGWVRFVQFRAGERGDAFDIEQILDGIGHGSQRTERLVQLSGAIDQFRFPVHP